MNNFISHEIEVSQLLARLLERENLQAKTPDPLLTRKEAAKYLGLSHRTLAVWATTKRYPLEMVKIGRLSKYKKSTLDAFILSRAIK